MALVQPKLAVDVKDIGGGELQYTDTEGKSHTYYPSSRIWLNAQTLELLTFLREPQEPGELPQLMTRVRGTAVLEDYSISVVGDPSSKVRKLSMMFAAEEPKARGEGSEPGPDAFESGELGRALLGFNRADWEIGNSDEWWVECYLPKSFIDNLVSEVRKGEIHGMQLSLSLRGLYTTEHPMAPVSSRGHLFIRPNRRDNTVALPELATGAVRSIHFASSSRDLRKADSDEAAGGVALPSVDDSLENEGVAPPPARGMTLRRRPSIISSRAWEKSTAS